MDRKSYWNDSYAKYWRDRVAEAARDGAASDVVRGDAKTEGDEIYERIFESHPFRPGAILDVGCAWGRMFPIFRRAGLRVSGIDISDAMIAQCRQGWGAEAFIDRIEAAEAETLPFADSAFDNLACLAVFDATFQDRALAEFMRVLAPGGHLYLTGKNATYHDDDALAFDAEVGARRKGHPNFFTDAPEMLRQLAAGGHTVVAGYYFARRGDFAEFRHVRELPDSFYEYLLVVHRGTGPAVFTEFSSAFSKTFQKRTGTG